VEPDEHHRDLTGIVTEARVPIVTGSVACAPASLVSVGAGLVETCLMALPPDVRVRRVRFREGTDDELRALHGVEVPIERERGSNRMPRPLASYIAFARDLPARFDDHAWFVETLAGDPVAAAYCWSNSAGDSRVMECDVLVVRERRRQGIGSRLLGEIAVTTAAEGRSLLDKALVASSRLRWTLLVRDPTGGCVGGTEVTYEPWDPSVVHQQNTGIDPAHRGLGLAKWAKATMLQRLRAERPQARVVRTDNAVSNASMLAINDALGFSVTRTRTEWQADVGAVRQALDVESR